MDITKPPILQCRPKRRYHLTTHTHYTHTHTHTHTHIYIYIYIYIYIHIHTYYHTRSLLLSHIVVDKTELGASFSPNTTIFLLQHHSPMPQIHLFVSHRRYLAERSVGTLWLLHNDYCHLTYLSSTSHSRIHKPNEFFVEDMLLKMLLHNTNIYICRCSK